MDAMHRAVADILGRLSDGELADVVAGGVANAPGIGGSSARVEVAGVPVFAKRIALTDLERHHPRSTANLFGVPPHCHNGLGALGSPGFGAWRELAAAMVTTSWVRANSTASFPLLHHWRVLPGAPPVSDEHADVDAVVAYWGGSPAIRARLEAVASASASIVLFQEWLPQTLDAWLADQLALGEDAVVEACAMVERQLFADAAFLAAQGFTHFDGHFANLLTDGTRLYWADLGLAAASTFNVAPDEAAYLVEHRTHDAAYAAMRLVNWLVTQVCGVPMPVDRGRAERNAYVRACAAGHVPTGVPGPIATMIGRHAPVAALMNDFHWDFVDDGPATPYPAAAIAAAQAHTRSSGG
jgi:hypothetical protein